MQRIAFVVCMMAIGLLVACGGRQGELRPLNPTPTAGASFSRQPRLVTFAELQANPQTYLDRFIRATGDFSSVERPNCRPYSGPITSWSLISENLRLDIVGFEDLADRAAEHVSFTVDGYFRLYEGPLGCGKEPPPDSTWYLEIVRVVQPNPISFVDGKGDGQLPAMTIAPAGGDPTASATGGDPTAATPQTEPAETPESVATDSATPTPGSDGSPTETRTVPTATPVPQASATARLTQTPSPDPSVTATATGTPTATATGGPTATTQPGATNTPLPTSTTNSAYPGPSTATAEPDPYP